MADKGRQIGVHIVEGLGSGPFVLQGAEKVDHLSEDGVKMLGRSGTGAALEVEALEQQISEAPARAVSGQPEGEVVDVHVAVVVGFADFLRILFQGVARLDGARKVQHQPLERVGHVGVFIDAPVRLVQVVVDGVRDVQIRGLLFADLTPLFTVDNYICGPH